jgi:nitrilase
MKLTIGLGQMNSRENREENLAAAERLIRDLANKGAELIMLPEYFSFLGSDNLRKQLAEPLLQSFWLETIRSLAQELDVYIHIGSCLERDGERIFNTGVVVDSKGEIIARYRKIHLFDVELPDGRKYLESDVFSPGNEIATFAIEGIIFGMATCYDLRFPELFRQLTKKGAQVLLVPAAFTLQTGRDHWEVLLRARAIENLCWVAAVGQWGEASPDHLCFGRSMVINPWGIIVAQAADGVFAVTADLDITALQEIRSSFPVLEHRRDDLF